MEITDEKLKELAVQVAGMAENDLLTIGTLRGVLAVYMDGDLRRLTELEKEIQEYAGPDWLNSGNAKDHVFDTMAFVSIVLPPDSVIIATVINDWKTTKAFEALSEDKQRKIWEQGTPSDYPRYFKAHDALMSLAQSPERVCLFRQRMSDTALIGTPDIQFMPQDGFTGRLKMFGVEPNPRVVETYAKLAFAK